MLNLTSFSAISCFNLPGFMWTFLCESLNFGSDVEAFMNTSNLMPNRNLKSSSCGFTYHFDTLKYVEHPPTDVYSLIFVAFSSHVHSVFTVLQSVDHSKFSVRPN